MSDKVISFEDFILQDDSPIYMQIIRYVKRGIVSGVIQNGDEMLSRRALSALLGVNPNTIQKAYHLLEEEGIKPYILSTEACAVCERCAYLEGQACRFPEKMHPCVESYGINLIPVLEENGIEFGFGGNLVTWVSLLFY